MTSFMIEVLSTEKAPQALGPYSQGLLINQTLYVSGQVGRDPTSGKLVSGGLAEEFKQALVNVGEILKAGGCDFSNVVKSTVLLADINDFNLFNDVYKQFFKGSFPARSTYQVAALPLPFPVSQTLVQDLGNEDVKLEKRKLAGIMIAVLKDSKDYLTKEESTYSAWSQTAELD